MKAEALILTTLMVTAGCIASPEDVDAASVEHDSPLLDELGAFLDRETTSQDAVVLRTNVTPGGGMAAFWWEVPEGVVIADDDHAYVEFLAAPVLLEKDRAALERWMIMGFLAEDGMLALNTMAFGAPLDVAYGGIMGGTGTETIERSLEPFVLDAGGKIKAGERIGFVVAGVASEDVELAIVLKPLAEGWDDDEDLPEDTEDFLAYVDQSPMVALPAVASGGLHQVAFLFEGGNPFAGASVVTGPVERSGSSTSALFATRRAETISVAFDAGGYGISLAGYDASTAAGPWSVVSDAHGAVSEASGTVVMPYLGVAAMPWVVAIGEGEAAASTTIDLTTTSAGFGEGVYLLQIDLDTTLMDLLGLPALRLEGLGGGGTIERDASGARLDVAGIRILAVGA